MLTWPLNVHGSQPRHRAQPALSFGRSPGPGRQRRPPHRPVLDSRPPSTQRAYAADLAGFRRHFGKLLRQVTLGDLQGYADTLAGLATASQARKLSAMKSLLSFGHRCGYLMVNVGAAVRPPKVKSTLANGIPSRKARCSRCSRSSATTATARCCGCSTSVACGFRKCASSAPGISQPRDDTGQVTVFGKGGKSRAVLLKRSIWTNSSDFVRPIRMRRCFVQGQAAGISIRRRCTGSSRQQHGRAGLPEAVSAHWLRHAHVSHALDHGAPAHLVQQTVGHASLVTTSRYAHARPSDSSSREERPIPRRGFTRNRVGCAT